MLQIDVLNKGLNGSCHVEPEVADWFSTLEFDLATLEIGINMRPNFEPEVFEKRSRYMVETLRNSHPDAILVLITHFLNGAHHLSGAPDDVARRQLAYDTILRQIQQDSNDEKLHLIEGTDLLTTFGLLSADMIHPTHEGHAQMGINLAERLRPLIT
jgi:lysophospholipase L1-like esterase